MFIFNKGYFYEPLKGYFYKPLKEPFLYSAKEGTPDPEKGKFEPLEKEDASPEKDEPEERRHFYWENWKRGSFNADIFKIQKHFIVLLVAIVYIN